MSDSSHYVLSLFQVSSHVCSRLHMSVRPLHAYVRRTICITQYLHTLYFVNSGVSGTVFGPVRSNRPTWLIM
jgi:hypothetical protein